MLKGHCEKVDRWRLCSEFLLQWNVTNVRVIRTGQFNCEGEISKAKNARSKRALVKRQPKLIENVKKAMFIRGSSSSLITNTVLSDLVLLLPSLTLLNYEMGSIRWNDLRLLIFRKKTIFALLMMPHRWSFLEARMTALSLPCPCIRKSDLMKLSLEDYSTFKSWIWLNYPLIISSPWLLLTY